CRRRGGPVTSPFIRRLLRSAVFLTITCSPVFLAPNWLFFLVVEVFILFALNEFLSLAETKGIVINRLLGLFFGGLLPFSFFFPSDSIILVIACLSFFLFNFHRRLREQALVSTSVTLFGVIYVAWFFSYLTKIKYLPQGSWWVFYTILLVKGGDAGAYFVGKSFGKMKLIEHVSPNKSVEGAIAGLVTTILLSFVSKLYLVHVDFLHLFILGTAVGILAQLGDLAESLIKRDVGVKDSGHIPGLGGVLDVLDSLILSAPFVYFYVTTFPGVLG
ncbi:MAG: phosphatidate cytidylyltransferase, partial [Candidatus Omnitrophica bacterium]|nr:phosphatidate cytidylyltransferase [Candidatus Omnitrophota bacterium]